MLNPKQTEDVAVCRNPGRDTLAGVLPCFSGFQRKCLPERQDLKFWTYSHTHIDTWFCKGGEGRGWAMTICRERTILTVLLLLPKPSCPSSGLVRNSRICLYPVVSQIARGLIPIRPNDFFFVLPLLSLSFAESDSTSLRNATYGADMGTTRDDGVSKKRAILRNDTCTAYGLECWDAKHGRSRSANGATKHTRTRRRKNKRTSPNVTELTNPNGNDGSLATLGHTNPLSSCAICRVFLHDVLRRNENDSWWIVLDGFRVWCAFWTLFSSNFVV